MNSLVAHRRHPAALAVLIMLALFAVGGAYAAISASSKAKAAPVMTATEVEEGKTLYLEGCSTCHGMNGEGTSIAPSLIGVGAAAVHFQVSSGRMPMAQPAKQVGRKAPTYNEEDTAKMAAFVASLGPGPAIPSAEDIDFSGANVAEGAELFRTNCAQCHNFAGRGAALTRGKYAPSLMKSTPQQMYEAMLTGPQNMPVFGDGTLHPEDKKAIISFISELQANENPGGIALGRFGPVTEGLFAFTAGIGLVIAVAIWIGAKAR